jgi:tetratricopeptide (TPR) repeat protein
VCSSDLKERQGNEHGAASTYHQLGMIAQAQRDFSQAEQWYKKSLEIKERQGNEHGAASTYHQLGIIAAEQGEPLKAVGLMTQAGETLMRFDDTHSAEIVRQGVQRLIGELPADAQNEMRKRWHTLGLPLD